MSDMEMDLTASYPDINLYWQKRWEQGNTGWHHQEFNAHLLSYWHRLMIPAGKTVFVPLCGKSRDMVWFAKLGYRIIGVEVSPVAVQAFFDEHDLVPDISTIDDFSCWQSGPYKILVGDVFCLKRSHMQEVDAIYDRASLVAFNPEQRSQYARLLGHLFRNACNMLLISMDYPQQEMQGPPYSVLADEIEALFAADYSIQLLDSVDLLKDKDSERYAERGLSRLHECVYLLQRNVAG